MNIKDTHFNIDKTQTIMYKQITTKTHKHKQTFIYMQNIGPQVKKKYIKKYVEEVRLVKSILLIFL